MTHGETRAAAAAGSEARAGAAVDFRAVFEQLATPCLLLLPDTPRFSVVATTEAYRALSHGWREAMAGAALDDVLRNAGILVDEAALETLRASLGRALGQHRPTRLRLQGVARAASPAGAAAAATGWTVVNTPVLSKQGEITLLIQRFEAAPSGQSSASRGAVDLDRQLAECRQELVAARAELEAFSYSVAHDLRAPLRAIDGFSQALAQDHASALGAEAVGFLEHIRAGAQRMSAQLDDLLELSRIQRTPLRKTTLDVSALAHRIIDGLKRRSPERAVSVKIAPQLSVHADSHLTAVLLEKLLGNAWKFTSKKPHASIELGREPGDDVATLFVADDGVGFDMAGAERLFSPFQRLHHASEFDGTGMGLAIAHRIVARHGGRIWARAEPGKGARFCWTAERSPGAPERS